MPSSLRAPARSPADSLLRSSLASRAPANQQLERPPLRRTQRSRSKQPQRREGPTNTEQTGDAPRASPPITSSGLVDDDRRRRRRWRRHGGRLGDRRRWRGRRAWRRDHRRLGHTRIGLNAGGEIEEQKLQRLGLARKTGRLAAARERLGGIGIVLATARRRRLLAANTPSVSWI